MYRFDKISFFAMLRWSADLQFKWIFHKEPESEIKVTAGSRSEKNYFGSTTLNAAVPGSNLAHPRPWQTLWTLSRLPPGIAQYLDLTSKGRQRYKILYIKIKKIYGRKGDVNGEIRRMARDKEVNTAVQHKFFILLVWWLSMKTTCRLAFHYHHSLGFSFWTKI